MNEELERKLKCAREIVDAMSPEERAAMLKAQAESWARAEASWPKPKFKWEVRNGVMTKVYASMEDYHND